MENNTDADYLPIQKNMTLTLVEILLSNVAVIIVSFYPFALDRASTKHAYFSMEGNLDTFKT